MLSQTHMQPREKDSPARTLHSAKARPLREVGKADLSDVQVKKFRPTDAAAISHFVREGYVAYTGIYAPSLIAACRSFCLDRFHHRLQQSTKRKLAQDVNGWAVEIVEAFAKTDLYDRFITHPKSLALLQRYLGPDLAILGYDALWINVPRDRDPVLLKGIHSDAWTGTSIHTLFAKTFFTDCDAYNGMSVCPGSHLQGMIPVRNRAVDPACDVAFNSVNLSTMKAGDLLIWHPLLLHSTTGHSDTNIRISLTSRYTSTETPFSSQERALGYRTLSVGPMNQVGRMIGNDLLTPFRTYGGFVGIDRRMGAVYPHSDYKNGY